MTRELRVVGGDVLPALRDALAGGSAILPLGPGSAAPGGLPARVPQRVALVVETSGSTGRPKRVALSADALLAGASGSESALGGPGQWVLALPTHYIAGLNVLVRSLAAGFDPVTLPAGRFDPEALATAPARPDAPRLFTALVPVQLLRLVEAAEADPAVAGGARRFERILVGGQATPAPLLERAARLGLRVTRTYGSSETSGGCVYDGVPFASVRMRVVAGQVELAGPVLAEGYLGDPARTAERFKDGWYRTGDTGRIDGGVLTVSGRLDDVIVSGGVKVSLGDVERAVRAVPGLEQAVVLGRADPRWGQVPVVVTDRPADLPALRRIIGSRLGPAARPAAVEVLDRLPLLPSGKPDRPAIRALIGAE